MIEEVIKAFNNLIANDCIDKDKAQDDLLKQLNAIFDEE